MSVFHVTVPRFHQADNFETGFFFLQKLQSKNWHRITKQLPVLKHGSMHTVVQELALFYLFRAVCVTDRYSKTSSQVVKKKKKKMRSQYRQQQATKSPLANKEKRCEIVCRTHPFISHFNAFCFPLKASISKASPRQDQSEQLHRSIIGDWNMTQITSRPVLALALSLTRSHTHTASLPHLWAGPRKGEAGAQWCCLCLRLWRGP